MNYFGLALIVAGFAGWVMNIVTLVSDNTMTTGMMIGRAIGIFVVPLGAALGYL